MAMKKIYILTFRDSTILKIQMCKIVNKSYPVCVCLFVCVSQPGGLLVAVAAVTTAVLQGETEKQPHLQR